jgi:ribonuclease R
MKSNQAGGSPRRNANPRPNRDSKPSRSPNRQSPPSFEDLILRRLAQRDYRPTTGEVLITLLSIPETQRREFLDALASLETQGRIVRTKNDRYIEAEEADLVPGIIQLTRQGRGFVQPDAPGLKEIAVPEHATGTAMHGDRVLVRRDVRPTGLRKHVPGDEALSGAVVRILERKRSRIVGTLAQGQRFMHVVPDDPRMQHNVVVPPPKDVGRPAQIGDKVVVEILAWEDRHSSPEGEIIEVLGPPDQEGVDMLSVLRQYDLPLSFPREVLDEARTIADARADVVADAEEMKERVDCRAHAVITIDPDDAKDFDDAICVEAAGPDQWKVWVHIADVSHYVRPGSELDTEARKRGNSTYLVDRVIPMLPEALSNELCSLKPKVDRLTKCVEFLLDGKGHVVHAKFYAAIIHSKHRFTYQEALGIIQGGAPATDIERMLVQAHELAQHIRRARFKNGSLDLDFPENKIRLDDRGRILRIDRNENDVSHQLIEEYMLLANEAVAAHLMKLNQPAIYRIHEAPKAQKLDDYREQVLSHHVPCGNLNKREEIQKLLRKLSTLPIGAALKIGFLRSLMRARYAVEPLGHYGLAKEKYTHFTSPIRRYADLIVHRVLFDKVAAPAGQIAKMADHISTTERNSADAERDSRDVKLYAHLEAQLGSEQPEIYDALVTEVRNFGFFIDVTRLGMSGMVHLSAIPEDFFIFDPERATLTGRQTRRVISLGDTVQVDRFKKQVDFRPAGSAAPTGGGGGRGERRGDRGGPRRERDSRGGGKPAGAPTGRPRRDGPPKGSGKSGDRPHSSAPPRQAKDAPQSEAGAAGRRRRR